MTTLRSRAALALLLLALALLAVAEHRRRERQLRRLEKLTAELGVAERHPQAVADLRRVPGRARSALRAARLLLAVELERGSRPDAGDLGDAATGLARLAAARELALEALAEQPASWQGWMVVGGSRFLELSRGRDPRLAAERESWREPLETARRLAPAQPEPVRLLAAAHLSLWSSLDDEERAAALEVVTEALRDPTSFQQLIALWLRVAPSREAAFAAVPEVPERWQAVMAFYAGGRDWERWCQARGRWLDALASTARERLRAPDSDPKTRRAGRTARRLLAPIAPMPPDPRFAPFVLEAFAALPDEERIVPEPRSYRGWLEWALDQCDADGCPFPPAVLRRLGEAAGPLGEVDLARLALAAGDRDRAASLAAGGAEEAAEWAPYRDLERRLAGRPAGASATSWSADAWRRRGPGYRLGPFATPPGSGLEIALPGVEGGGGAVLARLDGAEIGCFPVAAGARLRLAIPVAAGAHRLELATGNGGGLTPGAVRLLPASPATRPSG